MPPRYAYWTILIDSKPTAFRAREREELLPTLAQLRRTNSDVVMKWFARGRLWDSPEAEREAQQRPPAAQGKTRRRLAPGRHAQGSARSVQEEEPARAAWSDKDASVRRDRDKLGPPPGDGPLRHWPCARQPQRSGGGRRDKPGRHCSAARRPALDNRKPPTGAPRGDRPWSNKPPTGAPRGDRPWTSKPPTGAPRGDRPWTASHRRAHRVATGRGPTSHRRATARRQAMGRARKPPGGAPRGDRPWTSKPPGRPATAPRGDRPWRTPTGRQAAHLAATAPGLPSHPRVHLAATGHGKTSRAENRTARRVNGGRSRRARRSRGATNRRDPRRAIGHGRTSRATADHSRREISRALASAGTTSPIRSDMVCRSGDASRAD